MGRYVACVYDGVLGPEPYEALVPHKIAGWSPELSKDTVHWVKNAADRIAGLAISLPRHRGLEWCLNRSEGIATSDVEGISTTLRSLSLLESLRSDRDLERKERDRQVLGAVRLAAHAVSIGRRASSLVGVLDLQEMHRRLFEDANVPFEPGSMRSDDIWIGPRGATPSEALYVAPPAEYIGALCEDLVDYVSVSDLENPLLKAALAHLQFETIHPFPDGNGRVGRALIHCVLQRGWPTFAAVPLSAAIAEHKQEYFKALRPYQSYIGEPKSQIRDACVEVFIAFLANAMIVACDYAEAVGYVVSNMLAKWQGLGLRSHSAATAILEVMATMPAASIGYLSDTTGRSPHAVRRGLSSLVAGGVLVESRDEDTGHRVFEVPELLQVVDQRQHLLQMCWRSHQAGLGLSAFELVELM